MKNNLTICLCTLLFITCNQKKEFQIQRKIKKVIFYNGAKRDSFNDISFRLYKDYDWMLKFNNKDSKRILTNFKSIDSLHLITKDTVYLVEYQTVLGGRKHNSVYTTFVNNKEQRKIRFSKIDNDGKLLIGIVFYPIGELRDREKLLRLLVTDEEYEEMKVTSWED